MRNRIALVALALSAAAAGCISKGEYRKFVESTRAYYDEATPAYVESVTSNPALPEQSRKNRLGLVDDFGRAVLEAEERAGIREEPGEETGE